MEMEAEKTAAGEAAAHQTIISLPERTLTCSQVIFTVMMTLTVPRSITDIIASTIIIIIMTITMAAAAGAAMTAAIAVTGDGTAEATAAVIQAAGAAIPVAAVAAGTEADSINNPSGCVITQPGGFIFPMFLFN